MNPDQAMAALTEITANLDAYIERRAHEITEPRIAQVIGDAEARVNEVMAQAATDAQRSNDLVTELRRQIAVLERNIERKETR